MKILLVNLDSMITNLALEKIKIFHSLKRDEVRQIRDDANNVLPYPLLLDEYDKIYVSCVFRENKNRCDKWEKIGAEIGGSGYSLAKNLPPEIENIKPHINMGFCTRGCIRKCYFCVVPQKEGKIRAVGDIYDLWDGKSKNIIVMDNNILALPKHFFKIAGQLKKENLRVDFNQGLDHRLLTDDICKELLSLQYISKAGGKIRFAFDDISYKPTVLKALKMLRKNGLGDWGTRWYVYVGVKDTVENVMERINILRDQKQAVFLMQDKDPIVRSNETFKKIYVWTNHIEVFSNIPFENYVTFEKESPVSLLD